MPKKGQFKKTATARSKQQRAYNSTPTQKKNRASRNLARATMEASGRVKKGDGKDVDHKNMNPKDNRLSNLRVQKKSINRARNSK